MGDREFQEQQRIAARDDGFGKPPIGKSAAKPNNVDQTSSHYMADSDRFNRDYAAVDKAQREAAHKKKQD